MNDIVPIAIEPLSRKSFAAFGDVIATAGAEHFKINNGTTIRYHDLAKVETLGDNAKTLINIFTGDQFRLPLAVTMMERHPLGSQAFIPLQQRPFVVIVAHDRNGRPDVPKAFLAAPGQGVNYHVNVWHHPLVSLEGTSSFLVVDRGGDGNNLEEFFYDNEFLVEGN